MLQARQVTKRYGEGRTEVVAVDHLDLEVERGSIVLIVGPSGSGKTTLLQLLGCLMRPSAGSISLLGTDVTSMPAKGLPRFRLLHLGFVFQDFKLLGSLTALENVEVPLGLARIRPPVARERATTLLTELGLGDRLDHPPAQLSGGEKQRVAIARAMALGPGLILADEPTANLDSASGALVMERFQRLVKAEGCTVVVVSHDPRLREISDRVLWLQDGKLRDVAESDRPPAALPRPLDERPGWPASATSYPIALLRDADGHTGLGWVALPYTRPFIIGRSRTATLRLRDEGVSRRHARIMCLQPLRAFVISDLRSTNGIFVNGQRIAEPMPLRHGDRITIGGVSNVTFTFELEMAALPAGRAAIPEHR